MRAKDLIRAIDKRIDDAKRSQIQQAEVVAVIGTKIQVRVSGSGGHYPATLSSNVTSVQVGDSVLVARGDEWSRWTIISKDGNAATRDAMRTSLLAPPASLVAVSRPGCVQILWHAPVHVNPSFQVQHNDSATETNATNVFVSGATWTWEPDDGEETDTRYFRIRTVTGDLKASAWSQWVNATPGVFYNQNGDAIPFRPNISIVTSVSAVSDVSTSDLTLLDLYPRIQCVTSSDISSPPLASELDALVGTASDLRFEGHEYPVLIDNETSVYFAVTKGDDWYYEELTKAN